MWQAVMLGAFLLLTVAWLLALPFVMAKRGRQKEGVEAGGDEDADTA